MRSIRKLSSSNYANQQRLEGACVLNDTLYRIGMRWKMQVLYSISQRIDGFGALKRALPGISDEILARRLRELCAEGLVAKRASGSYRETQRGRDLLLIMHSLCDWEHAPHVVAGAPTGSSVL